MIESSQTLSAIAAACLIFAASSQGSFAQESRTVDGARLGSAPWKQIELADSDFQGSAHTTFKISQRKLPDRIQETWRDPRNQKDGPQVSMNYERRYTGYFSDVTFDTDFKKILQGAFGSRGASIEKINLERIGRAYKAVHISYGTTICFVSLRIIGRSSSEMPGFSGDGNLRIFVCGASTIQPDTLRTTALAFMSGLQRDGKRLTNPGAPKTQYGTTSTSLFRTSSQPSDSTSTASTNAQDNWQTRPIAIQWQGISELVAGEISFRENNRSGKMKATIPGSSDTCEGSYQLGAGRTGSWAIACTNALTATGAFTAFGAGNGSSGTGTDSRGNKIQFTIGGR